MLKIIKLATITLFLVLVGWFVYYKGSANDPPERIVVYQVEESNGISLADSVIWYGADTLAFAGETIGDSPNPDKKKPLILPSSKSSVVFNAEREKVIVYDSISVTNSLAPSSSTIKKDNLSLLHSTKSGPIINAQDLIRLGLMPPKPLLPSALFKIDTLNYKMP